MPIDILARLNRLPDAELVAQVKTLIRRERGVTAEVIARLAELDTRDVHLREGYSSLFIYCRDALGLSEWEAYNRIAVARSARRFPVILEMLAEGAVHLTAVRQLAPHLTPENHVEVLQPARGKTKHEVKEIVARLAPRPDVPCSVRRVSGGSEALSVAVEGVRGAGPSGSGKPAGSGCSGPPADETGMGPLAGSGPSAGSGVIAGASPAAGSSVAPGLSVAPLPHSAIRSQVTSRPAAGVTPLSPDRYKLQLTISGETLEMLRLAKDMLGHAVPSGDDAAVVERALRALLAELARKKFAGTRAPRSPARTDRAEAPAVRKAASRNVPAAVRRIVWVRDLGRCAFVGPSGHRCDERRFVEFHHVDPYALGGEGTVEGSSSGAGVTTITRAGCTSARGSARPNLFRNKLDRAHHDRRRH